MRIVYLFILSITSHILLAQTTYYPGAKNVAMGNLSSLVQNSWSAIQNPSALSYLKTKEVSVFNENRFGFKELGTRAFTGAHPFNNFAVGVGFVNQGFSLLSSNRFCLALSRKLGQGFSGGINLNYSEMKLGEDYGKHSYFSGDIGFTAYVNPDFIIAGSIRNITNARLSSYQNERVPSLINLGMGWNLGQRVFWGVEVEKNSVFKPFIKSGFEYKMNETICLRTGIQSQPVQAAFGFGLKMKKMSLDLASSYHQILGFSPAFALNYSF